MKIASWSNQGLFSCSNFGLSSEEEWIEDVLLSEDSSDGDEDETGGVGGGPPDWMLGWGMSLRWSVS